MRTPGAARETEEKGVVVRAVVVRRCVVLPVLGHACARYTHLYRNRWKTIAASSMATGPGPVGRLCLVIIPLTLTHGLKLPFRNSYCTYNLFEGPERE